MKKKKDVYIERKILNERRGSVIMWNSGKNDSLVKHSDKSGSHCCWNLFNDEEVTHWKTH